MPNLDPRTKQFLTIIRTAELPALGPEVRADIKAPSELLPDVNAFCREHAITGLKGELLRSGALLWHDDLDGSHVISQNIKNTDGSYLHGIMHRREPDSSNAKYWFRLVGEHLSFPFLATAVAELESTSESKLPAQLSSATTWDPFAFVDACEHARRTPNSDDYRILQSIQELELAALIDSILTA